MEQDLKETGAARSQHVVHVLPADDARTMDIVRTQVERLATTSEEAGPGLRLLVVAPAADIAARVAREVNDGLDADGALLVAVDTGARSARRIAGSTAIAVSAEDLLALIAKSVVKLESLESVVMVNLDELATNAERIDNVFGEIPKTASRVATTSELTSEVEAVLERHARKARRMTHDLPEATNAPTEYVICDRTNRTTVLARILDLIDPEHATLVASEEDAEAACAALAQLGYGPDDGLVSYSDGECPEGEALVVVYTAPADPADLAPVLEAEPKRTVVLVSPDERAGFLRAFGPSAKALALPATAAARSAVKALRDQVQVALAGSLHHEMLALAPLFEQHDPAEVAAALLSIVESRTPVAPAPATRTAVIEPAAPRLRASRAEPAAAVAAVSAPSAPTGTMTALFINVGEKDGARKGDLVGAITNEANITSDLLGKINMRDQFSVVEVDASVADRVIQAITGKTIRGRVVNARVDLKPDGDRGERRSPSRGRDDHDGPPRRRPPREGGFRGGFGDRPAREGGSRGGFGDRPAREGGSRGGFGDRPSREGGSRGGFGDRPARGGSSRGGFGERPRRDDADRGARGGSAAGKPRFAKDGERPRRSRDDVGGPRTFRDGDRSRTPKAMGEHREWKERSEQLSNSRRPRRSDG